DWENLFGDVLGGAVFGNGDVEDALPLRREIARVLAENVTVRNDRVVHPIAPREFRAAGGIAVPRKPIPADLERRAVGVIDRADLQRGLIRDALAERCREIPAATPALQKFRRRVVMRVVVATREADAIAGAADHDRV